MKISSAIAISAAVALIVSAAQTTEPDFEGMFGAWLAEQNKMYMEPSEFQYRLGVFTENYYTAKELTENDGGAVYDVTGPFADLTTEEFAEMYLSPVGFPVNSLNLASYVRRAARVEVDEEGFDWKDEGVVTDVRNQGSCGSCWAFSAIGAYEGVWAMAGNDLVNMSPQYLVDCDTEVDMGCRGGLMDEAYKYIIEAGGVMLEEDYPYEGKDKECRKDDSKLFAPLESFEILPNDEEEMASQIHETGPLAVALNASWLQFYRKGVSDPKICSPKGLNHGVLMTGYGTDAKKGKPFWNLKNSWGNRWGEDGYFRMVRGKNKCGLAEYVVAPVLAEEYASIN